MIHELNTPLFIILGRAELLQNERQEDPVVPEHVSIILEQAEKLQGIIERLRDEYLWSDAGGGSDQTAKGFVSLSMNRGNLP